MSIQDEIQGEALNESTEESVDLIKDYVLNDQVYTLNEQSSLENEESVSSEDVDGIF